MSKSDYDKYYKKGGTYVIPVEIFNELFDELERLSFNYEQALEDLDKKENIIKEVREFVEWHYKDNQEFYKNKGIGLNYPECDYILKILDKVKEI